MTVDPPLVRASVENAAESVGRVWPLYSDVAANPLAGFEEQPFDRAVNQGALLFGGRGYPSPAQFRGAWEDGRIDPAVLGERLEAAGFTAPPAALLDRMAAAEADRADRERDDRAAAVDRLVAKWLAAFVDQGQAAWSMPNREEGFYRAWRDLAPYDDEIPDRDGLADLPETAMEALAVVLADVPSGRWESLFRHHLAALPGWTGFVKRRERQTINPWQAAHPITLIDYLAVRLALVTHFGLPLEPERDRSIDDREHSTDLQEVWLTAWEESYRRRLFDDVAAAIDEGGRATVDGDAGAPADGAGRDAADGAGADTRPRAQLVFCIDTRSEIIRRHVERSGPYETFGYAGFFGIPMAYTGYESEVRTKSCPAPVEPEHRVLDLPRTDRREDAAVHDRWTRLKTAGRDLTKSLKKDVAAAFGFVETAGGLFGLALAARTLLPHRLGKNLHSPTPDPAEFCAPTVDRQPLDEAADDVPEGLPLGLTLDEKVSYAEAAFEQMGWTDEFAPVVVFVGHGTQTVNNPFKSSLDCGACAGSPGEPNARALAAICNDPDVRSTLRERGVDVAEDTVFVAGEHNTTTDDVTLFTDDSLPERHRDLVERLREDLAAAQEEAAAERVERLAGPDAGDSVRETERRGADWAETRPETGLSGNAAFVVGPRELTADVDLEGRAFLHSYDWRTDPDGDALEDVLTGPLVVGQMINAQYYFSTVDNAVYGSGSKVTHNPVGKVGVYQGNGGDLMTGLPMQSIRADDGTYYHEPLRMTVLVEAPVGRVADVIRRNDVLSQLLDNDWMSLTVIDPESGDEFVRYAGDMEWEPTRDRADPVAPLATDD